MEHVVHLVDSKKISHSGLEWGHCIIEYHFSFEMEENKKYYCPELSSVVVINNNQLEKEYVCWELNGKPDFLTVDDCVYLSKIKELPKYYFTIYGCARKLKWSDIALPFAEFIETIETKCRKSTNFVDFNEILKYLPTQFHYTSHSGITRYDNRTIKSLLYPACKALGWVN